VLPSSQRLGRSRAMAAAIDRGALSPGKVHRTVTYSTLSLSLFAKFLPLDITTDLEERTHRVITLASSCVSSEPVLPRVLSEASYECALASRIIYEASTVRTRRQPWRVAPAGVALSLQSAVIHHLPVHLRAAAKAISQKRAKRAKWLAKQSSSLFSFFVPFCSSASVSTTPLSAEALRVGGCPPKPCA
jgi:hypothetical protein